MPVDAKGGGISTTGPGVAISTTGPGVAISTSGVFAVVVGCTCDDGGVAQAGDVCSAAGGDTFGAAVAAAVGVGACVTDDFDVSAGGAAIWAGVWKTGAGVTDDLVVGAGGAAIWIGAWKAGAGVADDLEIGAGAGAACMVCEDPDARVAVDPTLAGMAAIATAGGGVPVEGRGGGVFDDVTFAFAGDAIVVAAVRGAVEPVLAGGAATKTGCGVSVSSIGSGVASASTWMSGTVLCIGRIGPPRPAGKRTSGGVGVVAGAVRAALSTSADANASVFFCRASGLCGFILGWVASGGGG